MHTVIESLRVATPLETDHTSSSHLGFKYHLNLTTSTITRTPCSFYDLPRHDELPRLIDRALYSGVARFVACKMHAHILPLYDSLRLRRRYIPQQTTSTTLIGIRKSIGATEEEFSSSTKSDLPRVTNSVGRYMPWRGQSEPNTFSSSDVSRSTAVWTSNEHKPIYDQSSLIALIRICQSVQPFHFRRLDKL